jgi:serpin B
VTAAHRDYDVDISLPRWNFSNDMDLKLVLQQMGLRMPFADTADFSGITRGLVISDAVHRANITVDEHGTEAAAVTAVAIAAGAMPSPPHVRVRADHPFAFAIVDTRNQAPLFIGTVTDPAAG